MELEGFGASLVGRTLYVNASYDDAWIPWEFISGVSYNCKLLITGEGPVQGPVQGPIQGLRTIEAEQNWTAIFRPVSAKDWSCIATVLRGMGPNTLLVFDAYAPPVPSSFVSYMDGLLADGRTIFTRIWIGMHVEIPAIPDAIFFPVLHDAQHAQDTYALMSRLPSRSSHGPWSGMNANDWSAILNATKESGLGMVISDVGESGWSLFWHKRSDSRPESHALMTKRGLSWARTGFAIVERNQE